MQALEGIVVLDLSRYGPGRFCTVTLADFGAEVITIEMPRFQGALLDYLSDDTSARYLTNNRNKKSITINLKTRQGKEVFFRLAEKADVVLEAFRPGVVERLGIGYGAISEIKNPRIVYCSLSGYGQDGPYANRPGHDLNYVALSGILDRSGDAAGPPLPIGVELADLAGGYAQCVMGILLALMARERTNRGQHVDVSILDELIKYQWSHVIQYFLDGTMPHRGDGAAVRSEPGFNIYATEDGYIALGIMEAAFWQKLCRALGREDLIPFQAATGARRQEIYDQMVQIFRTKAKGEWVSILEAAGVPVSPVNNLSEALSDPQVLHRKMVVEVDHPVLGKVKQLGVSIKLSETPGEIRSPAPRFGEHTVEILRNLGYADAEIMTLRHASVIE